MRELNVMYAIGAATPVSNGPAVGDRPWQGGNKCGDAKCRRWSPLDHV